MARKPASQLGRRVTDDHQLLTNLCFRLFPLRLAHETPPRFNTNGEGDYEETWRAQQGT
jgi:hypothetical protein